MNTILELVQGELALNIALALVKAVIGFFLGRLAGRTLVRLFAKEGDAHQKMLLQRISFYSIFGLFMASALVTLGFNMSVLLGAAGILTVAIGFASQTSASNLISGLFLLGERPFSIGDTIKVGGTAGEVLSIDLLSAKLRTFDNLYVRIPNETLVKSEITNMSRFPIRRLDIPISVAYKEDISQVRAVLMEVAYLNPFCMEEPTPLFIFNGYGDSALNIQFSVWAVRENFLSLRNTLMEEIKVAFDTEGIEIPFPQLALHAGSLTAPLPVKMVGGDETL